MQASPPCLADRDATDLRAFPYRVVVADAAGYQPQGQYDLITTFYIQLFPDQRASMLANIPKAPAPGGSFLFVSHDRSNPPSGWSEEDLRSLTTPDEIVAELEGLQIVHAFVLDHDGTEVPSPTHSHDQSSEQEHFKGHGSSSTLVLAVRPPMGTDLGSRADS